MTRSPFKTGRVVDPVVKAQAEKGLYQMAVTLPVLNGRKVSFVCVCLYFQMMVLYRYGVTIYPIMKVVWS